MTKGRRGSPISARRIIGYWVGHHTITNGRWLYAEANGASTQNERGSGDPDHIVSDRERPEEGGREEEKEAPWFHMHCQKSRMELSVSLQQTSFFSPGRFLIFITTCPKLRQGNAWLPWPPGQSTVQNGRATACPPTGES